MMGRTHALTGVLATTGVATLAHADIPSVILYMTLVPGFALIPDIDHAKATVSNTFGPFTRIFSNMLGHRRETHSLPGIAAFTVFTQIAVVYIRHPIAKIWVTLILILGWAAIIRLILGCTHGLRMFRARSWFDDLFSVIPSVIIVWFPDWISSTGLSPFPLVMVPTALAVGMIIHLIGDVVTKQGCPLLWPFSKRRSKLALFRAGGKIETWCVLPLVVLGIVITSGLWIIGL